MSVGVARQHASRGGDDAVDAEEEEVVEVVVDEEGGQDGDVEAEVVLLHHVARPGVDQEHEAAQDEVEHAAGGGQADADGSVQAPASGSEAGDRGRVAEPMPKTLVNASMTLPPFLRMVEM